MLFLLQFFIFFFQLSAQLNPNCPASICKNEEVTEKITLIHVQADGDNDTLHYIWDLTRQPSILVALCDRNTTANIQWNKSLNDVNAVEFSSKPKYTMSFVLTKVSFTQLNIIYTSISTFRLSLSN